MATLASEAALRVLRPNAVPRPDHQLLMRHHPTLGWEKIPGASRRYTSAEYSIVESINSRGLRGPEYDYVKPEGAQRVLVLGDSFVEGFSVDREDLVTQLLEDRLARDLPETRTEVINGGTAGYSTDQELLFFQLEGHRYQPDVTVLFFYDNDVWYNARSDYPRGRKPVFAVDEGGDLRLEGVPVPEPEIEALPAWSAAPVFRARTWLLHNSVLYRLARNSPLRTLLVSVGLLDAETGEDEVWPALQDWVYRLSPDPRVEVAWDLTERLLLRLRADVAEAGSRFLVFYAPYKPSVYPEHWNAWVDQHDLDPASWSSEEVGRRLTEITAEHGIELIDPTAEFRARARELELEGERLYFRRDIHWTPLGNDLAAEILARHLAAQPPSPRARLRRSSTPRPTNQ